MEPSLFITSILDVPESVQYNLSVNQSYAIPSGDTGKRLNSFGVRVVVKLTYIVVY